MSCQLAAEGEKKKKYIPPKLPATLGGLLNEGYSGEETFEAHS